MTAPTSDEVKQIAALNDPVIRNLQITQCYFELSRALAQRTGPEANWCTFATWASKQAGQSIRKEDLQQALHRVLERSFQATAAPQGAAATPADQPAAVLAPAAENVAAQAQQMGASGSPPEVQAAVQQALKLELAVDRVSEAVGRGNRKVFAEIGLEFARFLADFSNDSRRDGDKLERFLAGLRPGEPPDGQDYLRRAFSRYYRAFFETDDKTRAEMLLCANLEIGLHEQTRLQPEITEALDAAYINLSGYVRTLARLVLPFSGWLAFWLQAARRKRLEQAACLWLELVQIEMRRVFTATLMTIRFPPDRLVRLGDDLTPDFPEHLREISNAELGSLLAQIDPTPDNRSRSRARDWANLPDRLHFIAALFRCYQEAPGLFEPPFTVEQVEAIQAGRKPKGRL